MVTSVSQSLEVAPEAGLVPGRSSAMQTLNATVAEIARTDIPVLLQGESGTGKEVYGRLIHRLSAHNSHPLTKLGCTAIEPEELLASVNRVLKEDGESGPGPARALFLDGVDELDADGQRVLLSMLQENEAHTDGRKRLRLISTSTRELDREIEAGRFRRELYYRIAGVCIRLPALRERKEDIPDFLGHFLEKCAAGMGRRAPDVSSEEMEILQGHEWPGNIRELENLAKKIAALGAVGRTITEIKRPGGHGESRGRAPVILTEPSLKAVAREASRQAERNLILHALERTHWNRKQAAKQLQISYKALLYKIKQMGEQGAELRAEGEER